METYLREVDDTPLLSTNDEMLLSRRVAKGDKSARDCLVRSNLRLVVNIARKYTGEGIGMQDLIEAGNEGLLRAVDSFEAHTEMRFCSYAGHCINESIKGAIVNSAQMVRIPDCKAKLRSKWQRTKLRLMGQGAFLRETSLSRPF